MSENNSQATVEQGANVAQQAETQEVHPLDMPFEVQFEDDGELLDDSFLNPSFVEQQEPEPAQQQQEEEEEQPGSQEGNSNEGKNTLNFDDDVTADEDDDEKLTPEQMIEKLKAEGYDIKKPESEETVKLTQIKELDRQITEANNFLGKPMMDVIKAGLYQDLSAHYKNQNQESFINSPEFNEQLQDEINRLEQSSFVEQQTYYNSVQNNVKSYLNELTGQKNTLQNDVDQAQKNRSKEQRQSLQTEFQKFAEGGFLGAEISPESAKNAYKRITSGQLQKEVNSNHNLIAKLALFMELEDVISSKLIQPSYGEGVKATLKAIKEGDSSATSDNPLDKAMRSGKAPGNFNQGANNIDGRFGGVKSKEGQETVQSSGRFGGQG